MVYALMIVFMFIAPSHGLSWTGSVETPVQFVSSIYSSIDECEAKIQSIMKEHADFITAKCEAVKVQETAK